MFKSDEQISNKLNHALQTPAMLELSPDKNLSINVISSSPKINKFNKNILSGKFAFIILTNNDKQYLVFKRLEDYQSNHGVLPTFVKLGKFGRFLKRATILCGGEIVFKEGSIHYWNLKSGAFSLGTEFDEKISTNFENKITTLWLPRDKFRYIHESDKTYNSKFSPKGSIRRQENSQTIVSSDKTDISDDCDKNELEIDEPNMTLLSL